MINAIGNIIGGGSARISYAKQLAKAYAARVIADGGVVESLGCFTAFAKALGAFKPTLLLDFYQNAAAAYSLRKLSTTYTGSAIRVRRASDNTEQDIGFVSNELDTSALTTFCSGTDGFVKTWYDQSGNARNATQVTSANQPQIVDNGSVILENGKPTMDFDGTNDAFIASSVNESQPTTFFTIAKRDLTTGGKRNLFDGLTSRQEAGISSFSAPVSNFLGTTGFFKGGLATTNQELQMSLFNGASSEIYINGTLDGSGNAPIGAITSLGIGRDNDASDHFDGKYQELILYPSDQSTNRTGIETNINDFYSIY